LTKTIGFRLEMVREVSFAMHLLPLDQPPRQAAKALGVPRSTLQRDVAHNGPESGPDRATSDRELLPAHRFAFR